MQRVKIAAMEALCLLMSISPLAALSGCGSSQTDSTIQASPEAKKADEGLRGGMKEFMQSKGKTKSQSK